MRALANWYGEPLSLAVDRPHPLLDPFTAAAGPVLEMRAWPNNRRWIGLGLSGCGGEIRPVLLLADRTAPVARPLPDSRSWVDRIIAVTGWAECRQPPHVVDWPAVEERLGTALPGDYKQIAEVFGHGAFDAFLRLRVPASPSRGEDLVRLAESSARHAQRNGHGVWRPYMSYPAPGGLLGWAHTVQSESVFWLTGHPDPDRWPILVTDDAGDSWDRFEITTGEYVFRMLTDARWPLAPARHCDVPWFTRYIPDC